jgi:hypothetical protein
LIFSGLNLTSFLFIEYLTILGRITSNRPNVVAVECCS